MSKQFCTFTIANYQFGVDVLTIQEVIRVQEMTPVPCAPEVIRGLINLRGQILTVLDLRRRLELPPAPAEITGMNMVFQLPEGTVSFLVDQVGEVLDLSEELFEPIPSSLTGVLSELISAVYKLEDSLLLILDVVAAADITGTGSRIYKKDAPAARQLLPGSGAHSRTIVAANGQSDWVKKVSWQNGNNRGQL